MIVYLCKFETREDADAAMAALEEASLEDDIKRTFETQLASDTGDEE